VVKTFGKIGQGNLGSEDPKRQKSRNIVRGTSFEEKGRVAFRGGESKNKKTS